MYSTRNLTKNAYPTLNLDLPPINSVEMQTPESTLIKEEPVHDELQKAKTDTDETSQKLVVFTPTCTYDDIKWQPEEDVQSVSKPSVFSVETQTPANILSDDESVDQELQKGKEKASKTLVSVETQTPAYMLFGEAITEEDEMDIENISKRTQNSNNMLCDELIIKQEPEIDLEDRIQFCHEKGETCNNDTPSALQTTDLNDRSRKRKRSTEQQRQAKDCKSSQREWFLKACDELLTPNLRNIIKEQCTLWPSCRRSRYSAEYMAFCLKLYDISPAAYIYLKSTFCLPIIKSKIAKRQTDKTVWFNQKINVLNQKQKKK